MSILDIICKQMLNVNFKMILTFVDIHANIFEAHVDCETLNCFIFSSVVNPAVTNVLGRITLA